jgi:hypothetical protein
MNYEDIIEVPIAHRISRIAHYWKYVPEIRTTPVKCLLCNTDASAIYYCPNGCTCSPNKIQPRCEHHAGRAYDTEEIMYVLEDFRL